MSQFNPWQTLQEIIGASDTVTSALNLLTHLKNIDLNKDGTPDIINLKDKAEAWWAELTKLVNDGIDLIKEGQAVIGELRQKLGGAPHVES